MLELEPVLLENQASKFTISSKLQTWFETPASIAGVGVRSDQLGQSYFKRLRQSLNGRIWTLSLKDCPGAGYRWRTELRCDAVCPRSATTSGSTLDIDDTAGENGHWDQKVVSKHRCAGE